MHCRSCDRQLIEKARFCDDCGLPTASLDLDAEGLMSYCGKCSGLLRGAKKYCIYCGEPSPHSDKYKKKRETGWIEEVLMDPRVQMAIIAILLIIAGLPAVTPIRYKTTASIPFVTVVWEEDRPVASGQRVTIPRLDSFTMEPLVDETLGIAMAGGVTRDSQGNLYISDAAGHRVYRIAPNGERTAIAGNGERGFAGDGGIASSAELNTPRGLAIDSEDNLYIADTGNNRIRKVSSRGIIKTIAGAEGDPTIGASQAMARFSDANKAPLLSPTAVSVDRDGSLYVAESECKIGVRKPTVWVLKQKM